MTLTPGSQSIEIAAPAVLVRRLTRADEQLVLLDQEIRNYLQSEPYSLRVERGTEETERELFVDVREPFDGVGWALRVSDMAHHWRATLDNLIYMLSLVYAGAHVPGTEFPIYLGETAYRRVRNEVAVGPHKIRALPPEAQAIIERLQPWHTGQDDPLWMLQELNNADKHRIPDIAQATFQSSTHSVEPSQGVVIKAEEFFYGPFVNGTKVGRLTIEKSNPDATVDVQFKPTYQITFGEGTNNRSQPLPTNGKRILLTLFLMRDAVWTVVRDLQEFFTVQVTVTVTLPIGGHDDLTLPR